MEADDIDKFLDKCQKVLLGDKRMPPGALPMTYVLQLTLRPHVPSTRCHRDALLPPWHSMGPLSCFDGRHNASTNSLCDLQQAASLASWREYPLVCGVRPDRNPTQRLRGHSQSRRRCRGRSSSRRRESCGKHREKASHRQARTKQERQSKSAG